MSKAHKFGEPNNAIKFSNNDIIFEEEKLRNLLTHPNVKDREVVVFAIVGSYRRGKSFFMDYCLRFMYANYKSINNPNNSLNNKENWIGASDEPLNGFTWRSGSVRNTTGITFWSDVFIYDPPNGDPTAIILVDTQGLFDPETSTDENMKILSLGTLFSSTLILNLNNVIQEDQLEYLQFTTEYATFIKNTLPQTDLKPFQKFLFLIRDWQNVDDYDFGFDGGQRYLNEILKAKPNQSEQLQTVRAHIRDSFDQLSCYLMPYPGKNVAMSNDYDGRWSSMDEDFLNEMKNLIETFLKPQNLTAKKIDGVDVKAHELFEFIKDSINVFKTPGNIPKPKSLYELTIGKFLTQTVTKCFEIYEKNLKTPEKRIEIELIHESAKSQALQTYSDEKKMGNKVDADKYKEHLEKRIEKREKEWKDSMNSHFDKIEEEQRKAQEAADEIERIRKNEEIIKKKKEEEELRRQIEEQEKEIAKQKEELRLKQEKIDEELRKQKEIADAIERENALQAAILQEQQNTIRDPPPPQPEPIKIHIQELGINFNIPSIPSIPKPRCSVM